MEEFLDGLVVVQVVFDEQFIYFRMRHFVSDSVEARDSAQHGPIVSWTPEGCAQVASQCSGNGEHPHREVVHGSEVSVSE